MTLNNIKNHSDFYEKFKISSEKFSNIDKVLVATNRFFKHLECYGYETVKYSCTVDSSLNGKSPYQQLRESLYNGGVIKSTGYFNSAHHVVALREEEASVSRGILAAVGIDINSATNGILLPHVDSKTPYPIDAITETGHTVTENL